MENVVEMPRNRGVMPKIEPNAVITYERESTDDDDELQIPAELTDALHESESESDMPYQHVRAPEIRRGGSRILMAAAGACGAAAGAVMVFIGQVIPTIQNWDFGEVFFNRLAVGAIMLAAEFLLGFFALGDWLVWGVPMLCGMACGLRLCAVGNWAFLIGAAFTLIGITFAAARSADFSQLLLKLSRGGTVYMESSPRRSYANSFLGYSALVMAGAFAEGISTLL